MPPNILKASREIVHGATQRLRDTSIIWAWLRTSQRLSGGVSSTTPGGGLSRHSPTRVWRFCPRSWSRNQTTPVLRRRPSLPQCLPVLAGRMGPMRSGGASAGGQNEEPAQDPPFEKSAALPTELPGRAFCENNLARCGCYWRLRLYHDSARGAERSRGTARAERPPTC